MNFEWDEQKNQTNRQKHGISFDTAVRVFEDRCRIETYDEWHSAKEDRYITIGMVDTLLFVVYTQREESTRILSARAANSTERRIYYETNRHLHRKRRTSGTGIP